MTKTMNLPFTQVSFSKKSIEEPHGIILAGRNAASSAADKARKVRFTRKQVAIASAAGGVVLGSAAVIGGIYAKNPAMVVKGAQTVKAVAVPIAKVVLPKAAANYATFIAITPTVVTVVDVLTSWEDHTAKQIGKIWLRNAKYTATRGSVILWSLAAGVIPVQKTVGYSLEAAGWGSFGYDIVKLLTRHVAPAAPEAMERVDYDAEIEKLWDKYVVPAWDHLGASEFESAALDKGNIFLIGETDQTKIAGHYAATQVKADKGSRSLYTQVMNDFKRATQADPTHLLYAQHFASLVVKAHELNTKSSR